MAVAAMLLASSLPSTHGANGARAQSSPQPTAVCEGERPRTAHPPDIAAIWRGSRNTRAGRLETALREGFMCRDPAALVEILRTHGFHCGSIPWMNNQTVDVCTINDRRLLVGNARTSVRIENDLGLVRRITVSEILTDWL